MSLDEISSSGNDVARGAPHGLLRLGYQSDKTQGPRAETPGTIPWRSASPGKKGVGTVGRRCDDGSDSSQVIRKGVSFPTWEEARKAAVTPR